MVTVTSWSLIVSECCLRSMTPEFIHELWTQHRDRTQMSIWELESTPWRGIRLLRCRTSLSTRWPWTYRVADEGRCWISALAATDYIQWHLKPVTPTWKTPARCGRGWGGELGVFQVRSHSTLKSIHISNSTFKSIHGLIQALSTFIF